MVDWKPSAVTLADTVGGPEPRASDGSFVFYGKQLEYMRRQSTRAEVTRWQFQIEYHYGDFHGNSLEMMRREYDAHLHYANHALKN